MSLSLSKKVLSRKADAGNQGGLGISDGTGNSLVLAALAAIMLWIAPPAAFSESGEGSATMFPDTFLSCDTVSYVLEYTVGPSGLWSGPNLTFEFAAHKGGWSKLQDENPDSLGYFRVYTDNPDVVLEYRTWVGRIIAVGFRQGAMQPGDRIFFEYYGQVPKIAYRYELHMYSRSRSWEVLAPVGDVPRFTILPGPAEYFNVVIPGETVQGAPARLSVVAMDHHGNRASDYRGTILFSSNDPYATLPAQYTFSPDDSGRVSFETLAFARAGFNSVTVSDGTITTRSNYTETYPDSLPTYRTYWGDLQFHSGSGSGNLGYINEGGDHRSNYTTTEQALTYLKNVTLADFGCITEHAYGEFDQSAWIQSQQASERFHEPGEFVTFFGFEWNLDSHPFPAHRCVIYKDPGLSTFSVWDGAYDTPAELFAALDAQGAPALVIPHMMRTDDLHPVWDDFSPNYQRVGEIFSQHNGDTLALFEEPIQERCSYRRGWSLGHRIGVIGSSDNHFGNPGMDNLNPDIPQPSGLAAVRARAKTREGIWQALSNRRTYGTSGERILINFSVGGHGMGEEFSSQPGELNITGSAACNDSICTVQVFKYVEGQGDFAEILTLYPDADTCRFAFNDYFTGSSSIYYMRVCQYGEEMAWSSPVWVDPE